jgi:hypothetical protein
MTSLPVMELLQLSAIMVLAALGTRAKWRARLPSGLALLGPFRLLISLPMTNLVGRDIFSSWVAAWDLAGLPLAFLAARMPAAKTMGG